ncbi:hypothetical protein BHE74_00021409 [Ensete ventricosum]|nr:hypothetical protein BHE74_00021409 [Ensete ventricosum]
MLVNGASTDKIVSPSVGARFQGFPAHRSRSREIRTNFAGSFKRAESVSRTRFCFARLKGPNLTPSLFYDLEMVTGAWANKPIVEHQHCLSRCAATSLIQCIME